MSNFKIQETIQSESQLFDPNQIPNSIVLEDQVSVQLNPEEEKEKAKEEPFKQK